MMVTILTVMQNDLFPQWARVGWIRLWIRRWIHPVDSSLDTSKSLLTAERLRHRILIFTSLQIYLGARIELVLPDWIENYPELYTHEIVSIY